MYRKQLLITLVATLCWICSISLMAPAMHGQSTQKAKATPTPTPTSTLPFNATSTIHDFGILGEQLLMRSDNYNGTDQATYSTLKASKGAGNLITSGVNSAGYWELAFSTQSTRKVWVTPNSPIDTLQPSAPPAGYYVIQKAYSACRDALGNVVTFPNLVSGSSNCSMAVNFTYGGVLYKILMRPGVLEGTTCPTGGCPATGVAQMSCNVTASGQCTNWTITPNDGAPMYGVSNLYSYTGGRAGPWVFIGQYYNTFRVNAARP